MGELQTTLAVREEICSSNSQLTMCLTNPDSTSSPLKRQACKTIFHRRRYLLNR
ncbi:hypothetical protein BT93_H3603 [Corymbia citriodora subsp. variegata]|nr:hypothetical protein BT93_H3603 [Corymbia citriodora subsp. variegata]